MPKLPNDEFANFRKWGRCSAAVLPELTGAENLLKFADFHQTQFCPDLSVAGFYIARRVSKED